MSNFYCFRKTGLSPTWVNMETMETTRRKGSGIEVIQYHTMNVFREVLDALENQYGRPPIEVFEIPTH